MGPHVAAQGNPLPRLQKTADQRNQPALTTAARTILRVITGFLFAVTGGYELVLLLGGAALALAGVGQLSADGALFGRTDSRLNVPA